MTNDYRFFLESNFVGIKRLLVLVYSNQDKNLKRYKTKRYLPKDMTKNYNAIINGKNVFMTNASILIESNMNK